MPETLMKDRRFVLLVLALALMIAACRSSGSGLAGDEHLVGMMWHSGGEAPLAGEIHIYSNKVATYFGVNGSTTTRGMTESDFAKVLEFLESEQLANLKSSSPVCCDVPAYHFTLGPDDSAFREQFGFEGYQKTCLPPDQQEVVAFFDEIGELVFGRAYTRDFELRVQLLDPCP